MRAFAHRGGAAHPDLIGLENTHAAFQNAYDQGFRYLETDLHATRDAVLVAFHDAMLDRVTDSTGRIRDLTAAEVAQATIRGHRIPTMADLLDAFPDVHWNVDLKSDDAAKPLLDLIEDRGAHDRFTVAAFSPVRLTRFRRLSKGRVETAAHTFEVLGYRFLPGAIASRLSRAGTLQVPIKNRGLTVLTDGLITRAHAYGCRVDVWTIDEADQMHHLIDRGVDGIFSDRIDTLKSVLVQRSLWDATD
ncbi:MAG: glycerophosphodiester phosphodiesterase family protein [Nocardioides sp.]